MQRTQLLQHDLDWLPLSYRRLRWTVTGAVWAAMAGITGAGLFYAHVGLFLGKTLPGLLGAGYYAGDRVARRVLRGRLRRLAGGSVDLSALKNEADGELVHLRGRVRARQTLPALLDAAPAVYRRVIFHLDRYRPAVHEAAVDFELVDATGESITIEVEGARLLAQPGKLSEHLEEDFLALPLPAALDRAVARRARSKRFQAVKAAEVLLCDGDEVEVVGYKSRRVDPSVASRLERDTPMRATLRSGKNLPLVIAPVAR